MKKGEIVYPKIDVAINQPDNSTFKAVLIKGWLSRFMSGRQFTVYQNDIFQSRQKLRLEVPNLVLYTTLLENTQVYVTSNITAERIYVNDFKPKLLGKFQFSLIRILCDLSRSYYVVSIYPRVGKNIGPVQHMSGVAIQANNRKTGLLIPFDQLSQDAAYHLNLK